MTITENIYNSTSTTSLVILLRINGVIAMNEGGYTENFLTDGRGSVTEMIAGSGTITTYSYDAFGNVRTSGDSANPFTYNQERFDFGVGLQYLRARYVDLSLGRFVSRDSVLGTLEDPRTHNLFLYVWNDPLNHLDPSGHVPIVGSTTRDTVHAWQNCTTCNQGRNVPRGLNRCPRCGRLRVPTHHSQYRALIELHRNARTTTTATSTATTLRPPGGGDWVNTAIMEAARREHKKNSNETPAAGQRENFTVCWRSTNINPNIEIVGRITATRGFWNNLRFTRDTLNAMGQAMLWDGGFYDRNFDFVGELENVQGRFPFEVSMTYRERISFVFVYSWVRPGHNPPRNVSMSPRNMTISVTISASDTDAAIEQGRDELMGMANNRAIAFARMAYRTVLP